MDTDTLVLTTVLTACAVAMIINSVFIVQYRRSKRRYTQAKTVFSGTYVRRRIDKNQNWLRFHVDLILTSRTFAMILTTLAGAGLFLLVFDPLFMEPLLLNEPTRLARWIDGASFPDWLLYGFILCMVILVCLNTLWAYNALVSQLLSRYTLTWSPQSILFQTRYSNTELVHIDLSKSYTHEVAYDLIPIDPRYPSFKRNVLVHIFTQNSTSVGIMQWFTLEVNTIKKALGKNPEIDVDPDTLPHIRDSHAAQHSDYVYQIAPLHYDEKLFKAYFSKALKDAKTVTE